MQVYVRWPITAMTITKWNTVKLMTKISQLKIFCSHIKKVCFIQKRFAHIYKKNICLQIQKFHGNSDGKFLRQILVANSHGKILWQFPRGILEYVNQKMVWSNPLCGRVSHVKIKRKQITKQKFINA